MFKQHPSMAKAFIDLSFDTKEVSALVRWNLAHTQVPTHRQLFDPQFYPQDTIVYEPDGQWPDESALTHSALPRALHLVIDHGIYLSAGTREVCPESRLPTAKSHKVFPAGYDRANAQQMDTCDVALIPLEWIKANADNLSRTLSVRVWPCAIDAPIKVELIEATVVSVVARTVCEAK